MLKGAAERADNSAEALIEDVLRETPRRQNHGRDGITAILDEVEVQRRSREVQQPNAEYSSGEQEAPAVTRVTREEDVRRPQRPKAPERPPERRKPAPQTVTQAKAVPKGNPEQKNANRKKKRNHYSFTEVLKTFIPWKGDSGFEAVRKIVFSTALVVVGVCTFLISNYYIDRYKAKKEYEDIQARILDARANRHFSNSEMKEDPVTGEMFEWLDYNDYANRLLPINPDMVGYVTVPGTEVSYPVVQKRSLPDPNLNPNDYYLYRTFKQESSKSGCIFMDYRNHFDEVVDHRRVVDNSGNVFIYGHNMNNRTMFGSLRDYINNPSFYSAHPIVEYSSLYKDYRFKIFAIFIVDGEDFTSEYAFDAWNTLDFEDEEHFYHYVNEAKKRTLINTDVDVKYGEQLLSLYTCTGLVANAKLILMCRELRAGEDLYEGTENATLNTNVLYPWAYYKYGRPVNYDPKKFVPYGPET
jgi:sortase B